MPKSKNVEPCDVPGCTRSSRKGTKKGHTYWHKYCPAHEWRLRNHGDVQADKPIRKAGFLPGITECQADGCALDRAPARPYCWTHQERWNRHRDVYADVPLDGPTGLTLEDRRNWLPEEQ